MGSPKTVPNTLRPFLQGLLKRAPNVWNPPVRWLPEVCIYVYTHICIYIYIYTHHGPRELAAALPGWLGPSGVSGRSSVLLGTWYC